MSEPRCNHCESRGWLPVPINDEDAPCEYCNPMGLWNRADDEVDVRQVMTWIKRERERYENVVNKTTWLKAKQEHARHAATWRVIESLLRDEAKERGWKHE